MYLSELVKHKGNLLSGGGGGYCSTAHCSVKLQLCGLPIVQVGLGRLNLFLSYLHFESLSNKCKNNVAKKILIAW